MDLQGGGPALTRAFRTRKDIVSQGLGSTKVSGPIGMGSRQSAMKATSASHEEQEMLKC
jgi:hypothetical protein